MITSSDYGKIGVGNDAKITDRRGAGQFEL